MDPSLKKFFVDELDKALKGFSQDLTALSPDSLACSWGGEARTGYDIAFEVGLVNRRMAARLQGEDPGPWPGIDGWLRAPADFTTKDAILRLFEETASELSASIGENLERPIIVNGESEPAYTYLVFATQHLGYHDGQLNFIQSLAGDAKVH